MQNKYLLIFIFIVSICIGMQAQQEGIKTQYYLNKAWVNPAYVGFNGQNNLYINYRDAWSGFNDGPRDYAANFHTSLSDRVGLGLMINGESFGAFDQFSATLQYAYKLRTNTDWTYSIGMTTEYERYGVNGSVLSNPNTAPDPVLVQAVDGVQHFNVGIGFYGEYQDKFYAGLSFPQALRARINDVNFENNENNSLFDQFTFMLGYKTLIPDYGISLEPSLFMKRLNPEFGLRNANFQIDANIKAGFLQDQLIGGITYSLGTGDRLGFLIGTQLKAFRLYYSYDVSLEAFQDYSNGNHEITLGFRWDKIKVPSPQNINE